VNPEKPEKLASSSEEIGLHGKAQTAILWVGWRSLRSLGVVGPLAALRRRCRPPRRPVAGLSGFLARNGPALCALEVLPEGGGLKAVCEALKASDAAVVWAHGCQLAEQGKAAVREFIGAERGLVVVGAGGGAWTDWPEFETEVLGVRYWRQICRRRPYAVHGLIFRTRSLQALIISKRRRRCACANLRRRLR
jgi:hypothetical protein